jgi:hypothetical protein
MFGLSSRLQAGLCDEGDLACPHLHSYTLQWGPEQTRVLLALGGHDMWGDLTMNNTSCFLPSGFGECNHQKSLSTSQHEAISSADVCIEKISKPMAEKRPVLDVINGKRVVQRIDICDHNSSPIPIFTRAGVEASKVTLTTIGTKNSFVDGNEFHTSDQIMLNNGEILNNMCMPIAWSSNIPLIRPWENKPGCSIQLEMARQMAEALLSIDITNLDLKGEAANILWSCRDPEDLGFSEYIHDITDIPLLNGLNCVGIQEGLFTSHEKKGLGIMLYTSKNTVEKARENWTMSPKQMKEFLDEWEFGQSAISAQLVSVAATCVDESATTMPGDPRHSSPIVLPKQMRSFNRLKEHLTRLVEFGGSTFQLRVMSRNQLEFVDSQTSGSTHTIEELEEAQAGLRSFLEKIKR